MIEKFSVRKPFTIIVAVILILILGGVSFTKMQTDLLPNMNLPYVLVMTTYGGASPEEIEMRITKPVEQAVATVGGLENMSSTSRENVSMVAMEFTDDISMDAVTLDIREKLDLIKAYLPEEAGSPTILKLSMDMMPVLVTAIDHDEMDASELSEYVENSLQPSIESVEGVASVSTTGLVEESINVIINDKKIKKVNQKVKDALNGKFDEAEDKLNEADSKLQKAKSTLDSQRSKANAQIAKAKGALNNAQLSITEKEIQITSAKMTLQSKITEAQMSEKQLEEGIKVLKEQLKQAKDGLAQLESYGMGDSEEAQQLKAGIKTMEETLAGYEGQLAILKKTIKELNKQVKQMDSALKQIKKGQTTVNDQLTLIDEKSGEASGAMTSAEIQLVTNGDKVKSGLEQIEAQKEAALAAADVTKTLTVDTVKALLQAQNFAMPAGYVTEEGVDYLVRVGDEVTSQKELENLVLIDMGIDGLKPIKLKDVADVAVVSTEGDVYCKVNGNEGILMTIQKQSTYSASDVSGRIADKLDQLKKDKKGLHYTNLMDQGVYIDLIVNSVLENLILGAIFAIIVLLLFLKDLRPTLVVALSIPISVVFAIVLMYFTGITLNIISLSGLALGVGMLVDNSIVVIENIYRLRQEGMDAGEAAVEGAHGVAGAITASTLTTVSVFLPIIFTTGLTREIFTDMALTIGFSLVASLVVAITVVPMMGAGLLGNVTQKQNRIIDKVKDFYLGIMGKILSKKIITVLLALVLFAGSIAGIAAKGVSLFPTMESPQMNMTLTMPEGSTQEEMVDMANTVVAKALEVKDIETIGAMQSGASGMSVLTGGGSNAKSVSMYVLLKEDKKKTNEQIKAAIEKKTKDFDCELSISTSTMDMGAMGGSGVSISVRGNDLDKLRNIADQVAGVVEETKGTENVSNGQENTTAEVHIVVDKMKAIKKGLTTAQVYQAVAMELKDGSSATTVEQNDTILDVIVEQKKKVTSRKKLEELKLTGKVGTEEKTVRLKDIAKVVDSDSLSSISRVNQTRSLTVTADVKNGYNATKLSNKISKKVKKIDLPKGYTIDAGGEAESIREMMKQIGLMLLLAIIFMYLIMVAQFQSLLSPFIILFTIPLAFTGGILGLLIAGMDLSVIAMIGFVMLSGIIVNNGIVLVDTINQLREQGMEKEEAIITAGGMRLRPIFMTAMTTILGLSLMAIGFGQGSEMSQPMAVVTIGGLIYGTLLTLIVVPAIYGLITSDDGGRRFHLPKISFSKISLPKVSLKKKNKNEE
ncbi:MAG: efflux RND transporter permease subunit [Lachnospiraceae bacterium]|nr:efflux RND transporter permease subunit [Lachnospiraceae bacterium]